MKAVVNSLELSIRQCGFLLSHFFLELFFFLRS